MFPWFKYVQITSQPMSTTANRTSFTYNPHITSWIMLNPHIEITLPRRCFASGPSGLQQHRQEMCRDLRARGGAWKNSAGWARFAGQNGTPGGRKLRKIEENRGRHLSFCGLDLEIGTSVGWIVLTLFILYLSWNTKRGWVKTYEIPRGWDD